MILWAAFALMTAAALALLLRPLLAPRKPPAADGAPDVAVYRAQLAEIERDRERGLIGADDMAGARAEIERRLLRAAERATAEASAAPATRRRGARAIAIALAGLVPLGAVLLYLDLGAPGLPAAPYASRAADQEGELAALNARVDEIRGRIAAEPGDAAHWAALGEKLRSLRRFAEAADAFGRAVALGDGRAALHAARGEMLVLAAGGIVTAAARASFDAALAAEPREPRARYFKGIAALQTGEPRTALRIWLELEAESTADAPWLPILRRRIGETAAANGIDVAGLRAELGIAAPPPGPDAGDIEAASRMAPAEREAMVRGMVDRLAARLAAAPDDVDGWRRLGRSYSVLGEREQAAEAYARAAALAPEDPEILLDYGEALLAANEGEKLPAPFVKLMERVLELQENNVVALWYLGVAELEAGRRAEARGYWRRLLALIPEGAPERAELERRMAALEERWK